MPESDSLRSYTDARFALANLWFGQTRAQRLGSLAGPSAGPSGLAPWSRSHEHEDLDTLRNPTLSTLVWRVAVRDGPSGPLGPSGPSSPSGLIHDVFGPMYGHWTPRFEDEPRALCDELSDEALDAIAATARETMSHTR